MLLGKQYKHECKYLLVEWKSKAAKVSYWIYPSRMKKIPYKYSLKDQSELHFREEKFINQNHY